MRMQEIEIHNYARQLLEAHGDKAVAEALANAELAEHDHRDERDHVHEAVPAHGKRAEAEDDRVELRVGEQSGYSNP